MDNIIREITLRGLDEMIFSYKVEENRRSVDSEASLYREDNKKEDLLIPTIQKYISILTSARNIVTEFERESEMNSVWRALDSFNTKQVLTAKINTELTN